MDSELRIERLLSEASAKVIWGDPVDEVREWLEDRGVPSQRIDEVVAESLRERDIEFRKKGITELVIGAIVVVPPLVVLGVVSLIGLLGGADLIAVVFLPVALLWCVFFCAGCTAVQGAPGGCCGGPRAKVLWPTSEGRGVRDEG